MGWRSASRRTSPLTQVPLGGLALRPTAPSAVYRCSVGGLVLLNTVCQEAAAYPACGRAGAVIPVRRSLEIRLSCLRGPEVMHGLEVPDPGSVAI